MGRLLIIDDERNIRFSIASVFAADEMETQSAENGEEGLRIVSEWNPDVILLDLKLGQDSGLDVLQQIRAIDPTAIVILMTGFGTSEVAIEAMKHGAFDYIVKPLDFDHLQELIRQAVEIRRLATVPGLATDAIPLETEPQPLIGGGVLMRNICKQIGRIAPQDVHVLLLGENGTGKELVARTIYQHSRRHTGPFHIINCAAISEKLLESELFGHEQGVFAEAQQQHIGKIEQCHGGTLLLDEVGELSPSTQAKLLRLLQDGCFERIGSNLSLRADVRILAATNRDLDRLISQGKFRLDLLYRLRGFTITLPPLRKRREDIPELAHHFLFRYRRETGSSVQSIAPETLEILSAYSWPGNVRELQNVIWGALIASTGMSLSPAFLPPELLAEPSPAEEETLPSVSDDLAAWQSFPATLDRWLNNDETDIYRRALESFDRFVIGRMMRHVNKNQARAAAILGLSRITVRNKLKSFARSGDVPNHSPESSAQ